MNAENQEFRKKMNSLNRMMQDWLKLCRKLRHKLTGIVDLWHHLWHQKFGTLWSVGIVGCWDPLFVNLHAFSFADLSIYVHGPRWFCYLNLYHTCLDQTCLWWISVTWHILTPSPDTLVLPTKEPYIRIRICRLIRYNLERQRESVPIPHHSSGYLLFLKPIRHLAGFNHWGSPLPQNRRNRDFPMIWDVVFVVFSCLLDLFLDSVPGGHGIGGELNGNERAWWSPAATREATYFQHVYLGGGNSKIFLFSPRSLGEMNQFWPIFFNWVVQPPTSYDLISLNSMTRP